MKICLLIVLSSMAWIGTSTASALDNEDKHPCKAIKKACEAAGYTKGAHKGTKKGLHIDCLEPIMAGQTVQGVSIPAQDIAACKEKKSDLEKSKS